MKRRLFAVVPLVLILVFPVLAQQRGMATPPLRSSMMVTTDWLADHLHDPSVVVLHIGRNKSDYDTGHIPGARFIALTDLAVTRNGLLNELPTVANLKRVFERAGAGDDTRVVLYGELQGLLAARGYFSLDYLGHGNHAALLDGGLEKWREEERPVTNIAPKISPAVLTPHPHPRILVKLPELRKAARLLAEGRSDLVLLDSRPAEFYSGDKGEDGVKRPGHIPGAVSMPWTDLIESKEDPQLKPPPEARSMFASEGVTPGKRVITYCRTGIQASFDYFVAKFLGYDAAMYDGSFSEWSNQPDTKVATGKGARSAEAGHR